MAETMDSRPAIMGLTREQVNVAMKDKSHLKRWLTQTGRRWMVLNTADLVDALWDIPGGVDQLMLVLAIYRDHRRTIPNGRTEIMIEPLTMEPVEVPLYKDELLELEELDRAIRHLIEQASKLGDQLKTPWSLEGAPL